MLHDTKDSRQVMTLRYEIGYEGWQGMSDQHKRKRRTGDVLLPCFFDRVYSTIWHEYTIKQPLIAKTHFQTLCCDWSDPLCTYDD